MAHNIKKQKSCGLSETPKVDNSPVPCNGKLFSTKCVVEDSNLPGFSGFTQHEFNTYINAQIQQSVVGNWNEPITND